jgi:hypothetical protein
MKALVTLLSCLILHVVYASAKSPRTSDVQTDVTFEKAVKESSARAIAMFPDCDTDGTSLHHAIQEELEWQKKHNPAALNEPDWPERCQGLCGYSGY